MKDARVIAEETARASYGRLLAWLAVQTHDLAAAEDALADAFRAALETWPERGAPDSPEAWLLTAARRRLIDEARRAQTQAAASPMLEIIGDEKESEAGQASDIPDQRLKLLFVCAHPAIDPAMHTPLMLQTVLGLEAERIASAFLIQPAAMAQRLVRIKRKIKNAGIPFELPNEKARMKRISAVLDAIYAAYTTGWDAGDGVDARDGGLTREAIFLARLMMRIAPKEPEAYGILALMLHAEARRRARIVNDRYKPLAEQDTSLWDKDLIAEAETALAAAWRIGTAGRFQIEAAIQSAHAAARLQGVDARQDIVALYDQLMNIAPSIGAAVGRAAALAELGRVGEGLQTLDEIPEERVARYQSYWAVRAHLDRLAGQTDEARCAYQRAIGLADDPPTRRFLQARLATLEQD